MKKVLCTVLAVVMAVVCFAGCSAPAAEGGNETGGSAASGDTIKVGLLGPYTGDLAVYGLAVKNGATLYFDKVNAEGGINGKKIELISYDNKGDDAEAINAFNREVDEGITAFIGDVITSNTIAVAGEANAVNMPMITASATAEAVRTFQRIFNLPQTGVTDYPTWFEISDIYVGVTRIAEPM